METAPQPLHTTSERSVPRKTRCTSPEGSGGGMGLGARPCGWGAAAVLAEPAVRQEVAVPAEAEEPAAGSAGGGEEEACVAPVVVDRLACMAASQWRGQGRRHARRCT